MGLIPSRSMFLVRQWSFSSGCLASAASDRIIQEHLQFASTLCIFRTVVVGVYYAWRRQTGRASPRSRSDLLTPHCELVAVRVEEVETLASRELEDLANDLSPRLLHLAVYLVQ